MMLLPAPYNGEKEYVSEKITHPLAKKHELPDADYFHYRVNSLAHTYFQMKDYYENRVTRTQAIQKLDSISKTAKKLKRLLEDLDPITDRAMWRASGDVSFTNLPELFDIPVGETITKVIHGNPKTHYRETEQSFITDHIQEDVIRTSLDLIFNYAEYGKTQLPPKKEGPIRRMSVDNLIANFYILWHDNLGRKFTCDSHEGECITPAYVFCEDTALAIDSEITKSQIKTYMRRTITSERRRSQYPRYKFSVVTGSSS